MKKLFLVMLVCLCLIACQSQNQKKIRYVVSTKSEFEKMILPKDSSFVEIFDTDDYSVIFWIPDSHICMSDCEDVRSVDMQGIWMIPGGYGAEASVLLSPDIYKILDDGRKVFPALHIPTLALLYNEENLESFKSNLEVLAATIK